MTSAAGHTAVFRPLTYMKMVTVHDKTKPGSPNSGLYIMRGRADHGFSAHKTNPSNAMWSGCLPKWLSQHLVLLFNSFHICLSVREETDPSSVAPHEVGWMGTFMPVPLWASLLETAESGWHYVKYSLTVAVCSQTRRDSRLWASFIPAHRVKIILDLFSQICEHSQPGQWKYSLRVSLILLSQISLGQHTASDAHGISSVLVLGKEKNLMWIFLYPNHRPKNVTCSANL